MLGRGIGAILSHNGLSDKPGPIQRVDLPGVYVGPNQSHTFTFTVTAPMIPGTYAWEWMMVHEGVEWFGDASPTIWVEVPQQEWSTAASSLELVHFSSGQTVPPTVTGLVYRLHCRGDGWLTGTGNVVRLELRVDGTLRQSQNFGHGPGFYNYFITTNVGPSQWDRTEDCRVLVNGVLKSSHVRTIPSNGPLTSEMKIKTFIRYEWVNVPGSPYPLIAEGDNRSFDLHSNAFRTRMWGWLNNPAFNDSQIFAATTAPIAGESRVYDPLTSLDGNLNITAAARADMSFGPPLKVGWATADMNRVYCSEAVQLGVSGVRAGVRLRCQHESNIPIPVINWFSPDIDWRYNIDLWFGDGSVYATIHGNSCIDKFPSHELWVSYYPLVLHTDTEGLWGLTQVCAVNVQATNVRLIP